MSDAGPGYDLLVAGGGMVGATMALAAARGGLRVAVLEATPWNLQGQPSYDDRTIALAEGSRRILADLDLWSFLADDATPIEHIHVSDRGHFGAVRLDAAEEGVAALGYVLENRLIGRALYAALADSTVELHSPARVESIEQAGDRVRVRAESSGRATDFEAAALVVADGTRSSLRDQLGIRVRERDYAQTAVVANLTPAQAHRNRAFERFTDTGPIALLPMSDNRCALVLTVPGEQEAHWMGLGDARFMHELQDRFGRRLGRFVRVGQRAAYPLKLVESLPQSQGRVVLVGNAARTLHPVAGQGFNLALRDLVSLAEVLIRARAAGRDPGEPSALEAWIGMRWRDQRLTVGWTDALVRVFSTGFAPLGHARAAGLLLMDLLPPLRHAFARRSMGLHGRRPALAGLLDRGAR